MKERRTREVSVNALKLRLLRLVLALSGRFLGRTNGEKLGRAAEVREIDIGICIVEKVDSANQALDVCRRKENSYERKSGARG